MKTITSEALKLMVALSMTEKEVIIDKLTNTIEKYRSNPEKSEAIANTIIQYIENLATDSPTSYSTGPAAATREDIGLLLLEIQKLRNEVSELKQNRNDV